MSWDRLTAQPSNKTSSMETWTTSSDTSTRLTLMSRTTWRTWSIQSRNGAIGFELDCNTLAEFASSQIWTRTGIQIIAFAVNNFDAYFFLFRYSSLTKPLPPAYGKRVTDTYVQESSQGRLWRMIFLWVIQQRSQDFREKIVEFRKNFNKNGQKSPIIFQFVKQFTQTVKARDNIYRKFENR